MKTENVKIDELNRAWWVIDAEGLVLGRLAAELAKRLRGKDKATYSPHLDVGDNYIVINADKIRVTGRKMRDKMYYRHTGYPGGIKSRSLEQMLSGSKPESALELAVKGMLPKGPLGYAMYRKLKVYAGTSHPHVAQQPQVLEIKEAE